MKLFRNLNLLGTLLMTFSSVYFSVNPAYSGEGRNGPDQAGEAIPLNLDKEITTAQVEKIFKSCYQNPLNQIIGNVVDDSNSLKARARGFCKITSDVQNYDDLTVCKVRDNKSYTISNEFLSDRTQISISKNKFVFDIVFPVFPYGYRKLELASPERVKTMPHFTYETVIGESSISVFGEIKKGKELVRNLKLIGRYIEPFYLQNTLTGYETGIEVDLREVASCLENGIADL